MGSQFSKPVRSAANTISRRQYPKQPSAPTTAAPNAAQNAAQPESRNPPSSPSPPPPFYSSPKEPQTSQGPVVHSKEEPSSVKSDGMGSLNLTCCDLGATENNIILNQSQLI